MNTLDVIVIAIVALSGLFAFVRGFVREVLSIAAWIAAGVVAGYGFTPVQPYARHYIQNAMVADIVCVVGLFILSLLVFSIFVGALSERVRNSGLGPVDRALGLAFGVARAALLLCVTYLVATLAVPSAVWPQWVAEARSRPLLAAGAASLQALIPTAMLSEGSKALGKIKQKTDVDENSGELLSTPLLEQAEAPSPAQPPDQPTEDLTSFDRMRHPPSAQNSSPTAGYDAQQTKEMDRLFQQSLGSGHN
jgi:membrane protein required for colicin V production